MSKSLKMSDSACDEIKYENGDTESDNKHKISSHEKKTCKKDLDSDNSFDYNLVFESDLKDKPEAVAFILKLQKYIKKLEKKVKKLKSNLKSYRSKKKTKDASTQTNEKDESNKSEQPKTLSEEITEAAENAMLQTGFVYEATSGMYYDYTTGYYYNAELGLYYDGNSGTYLVYNNETKTYDFHSQVDVVRTNPVEKECSHKRTKQPKKQVKNSSIDGLLQNFSQLSIDQSRKHALDVSKSWPPCMRIILKETSIEKLKVGSLFIITCDGGTVGREGDHSIILPDINVSKSHAQITFDREESAYKITDLGSQNGTILNGKRISGPKQKSEPQIVVHGSVIQLGGSKLLCHVHDGQKTCGHCEPGLLQVDEPPQETEKSVKKSTQHKKELRRLRKKFGLETQGNNSELAAGYSDRAEVRRKTVGSHDDNEKTQVASLDESIASDNKGFKMLAKMGWSEGQALGKDGSGLKEPVALVSNPGTAGLGRDVVPVPPPTSTASCVWRKAQQRYQRVQNVSLEAFKESSSGSEPET